MPKFTIIRRRPAEYIEQFVVTAASGEEATRSFGEGRAACVKRGFVTKARTAPVQGPLVCVVPDTEATAVAEFDVCPPEPAGEAFNNARFYTFAGAATQLVVQEYEDR